ncbi:MAG: YihY/virulence factor BrkB family protein [Tepidiformaceae bacterium]
MAWMGTNDVMRRWRMRGREALLGHVVGHGGGPDSRRRRTVSFLRDYGHEASKDDLSGLAAELSYRFFLALFPFLILVAALGGFIASAFGVANPTQSIMSRIGDGLPGDARSVLQKQVQAIVETRSVGLLSVGIVGALWASSGAAKAIIKALNRVNQSTEARPFWKRTAISFGLVLLTTFGLLGSAGLYFATSVWGGSIANYFGAGGAFSIALAVVVWPVAIALLTVSVATTYWFAPAGRVPFKAASWGALVFVATFLVMSVLFGLYVSLFGAYNKTYGTLGGVVVMLTWLYITNLALLGGAELDWFLAKRKGRAGAAPSGDAEEPTVTV